MSTQQEGARVPVFTAGDRLWKARELTGLGQTAFAELLGISRGSVSNAERSASLPKPIVLKAWAMATGVSVEWLETGQGSPSDPNGQPGERDADTQAPSVLDPVARLAAKKARHAARGATHRYAA